MSLIRGPQHETHDLSMEDAIGLAKRDYARLLHIHDLSWQIDLVGAVQLFCSCKDEPIHAMKIEGHIRDAVRRERGPVRGFKK